MHLQRWLLPVLAALFFLSGTSGLIYQSLWLRLLSLVFGVTVYAASTVLASFMAGLALGTFVAGRLARRITRPLAWFGAIELGIGGLALLTPWALDRLSPVWIALQGRVPDQMWALTIARFVCSLTVLVLPTMLMGATLPLVVRSSLAGRALAGPGVGLLYAANTAGAITGALLAGFLLIGAVGIWRSFQLAALASAVVGLSALALAFAAARGQASAEPSPEETSGLERVTRLGRFAFALSGFIALALEI